MNTMSLSPGSVSADLKGDRLIIHVLDEQFLDREEWQSLESLVADLFGVQLAIENSIQGDRHE
jgi:multisubunit Na+/H+ antiporter MnhE subunit